jgi:hypothetical protein
MGHARARAEIVAELGSSNPKKREAAFIAAQRAKLCDAPDIAKGP